MSDDRSLAEAMLAVPTAPELAPVPRGRRGETRSLEVQGDALQVSVKVPESATPEEAEGQARDFLKEKGLDPADWVVTTFRVGEWTMANGETGQSVRYGFARRGSANDPDAGVPLDEILALVEEHRASPVTVRPAGNHAYIVAIGDMQFGKVDGDGYEGALRRVIDHLNEAADTLAFYRRRFDIGHVHIAWLGDHIEGFQSQGGANAWRTNLPLTAQIRLARRVMMHALMTFAPLAERVTMVAVPGNHGETQRFAGKGITTYADSFDTDALVAVAEAAELDSLHYGHVEFFVPDGDEMTVTLDLAGTRAAHAHGHQFRPGKHFDWWKGQAFGGSPLADADLLLLGHLHHELIEGEGRRMVIQVPSEESESTWWRHSTGTRGNPGLMVAITKDGHTSPIELVRSAA